jgi:hypothetical protein
MPKMPGFIAVLTANVGPNFSTVTAWEHPDDPRHLLQHAAHRESVNRMYHSDFIAGGMISICIPTRIKSMGVRCSACGRLSDHEKLAGLCTCGAALPAPPPYW